MSRVRCGNEGTPMTNPLIEKVKMNQNVEFIKDWCEFGEHRVYILMAFARKKHNEELTNSTEKIHRRILREEDDIEEQLWDLRALMDRYGYTYRIYLTVNARDVLSAYFYFQNEMNTILRDYENGDEGAKKRLKKLDSEWKSVVHKSAVKDDSYFMFDVDGATDKEENEFVARLPTRLLRWRKTPNGSHFITEPFNYTDWESPIEYDDLSTDGMVFVYEGVP